MGRSPCCEKAHTNKGAWTKEEDQRLISYIRANGEGCWRALPKAAGLARCGKSCRLRWINYLRPDLKRGNFTDDEDDTIIKLHAVVGNKWSLIAARLPGRTDNEIKNYWNTHIKRKLLNRGIDPQTHRPVANSDTDDGTRDSKIAGSPRRLPITIHWKTEPPATTTIALDSAPVEPHRDAFFSSQSPLLPVKPEPADGFNVDQTASSSNSSGRSAVEDNDPTTTSVTADDCHHRNNYGDDAGGIDLNLSISLPSYTSFSNHHHHHSSPTNSQASFTASPICRSPSTIAATSTSQSQPQQLQHYTYYAAAAPHHAPPAHPCTCPLIPLPSPTTTTAASIHLPPPPGVVNPYAMFGFFVPLQGSPGFGQRALHQE